MSRTRIAFSEAQGGEGAGTGLARLRTCELTGSEGCARRASAASLPVLLAVLLAFRPRRSTLRGGSAV